MLIRLINCIQLHVLLTSFQTANLATRRGQEHEHLGPLDETSAALLIRHPPSSRQTPRPDPLHRPFLNVRLSPEAPGRPTS